MSEEQQFTGLPRVPGTRSIFGNLDGCDYGHEVSGWIFDASRPTRECELALVIDGREVVRTLANVPRPDLVSYGVRQNAGFRIPVPAELFDGALHEYQVLLQPERLALGAPGQLSGVIRDHAKRPKQFAVDTILRLRDQEVDYDTVFPPEFLERHGVSGAVAYGYLWLLKRPADREGWVNYARQILAGQLSLGQFLRDLAASHEGQQAQASGIALEAEFRQILAAAARLEAPGTGP